MPSVPGSPGAPRHAAHGSWGAGAGLSRPRTEHTAPPRTLRGGSASLARGRGVARPNARPQTRPLNLWCCVKFLWMSFSRALPGVSSTACSSCSSCLEHIASKVLTPGCGKHVEARERHTRQAVAMDAFVAMACVVPPATILPVSVPHCARAISEDTRPPLMMEPRDPTARAMADLESSLDVSLQRPLALHEQCDVVHQEVGHEMPEGPFVFLQRLAQPRQRARLDDARGRSPQQQREHRTQRRHKGLRHGKGAGRGPRRGGVGGRPRRRWRRRQRGRRRSMSVPCTACLRDKRDNGSPCGPPTQRQAGRQQHSCLARFATSACSSDAVAAQTSSSFSSALPPAAVRAGCAAMWPRSGRPACSSSES